MEGFFYTPDGRDFLKTFCNPIQAMILVFFLLIPFQWHSLWHTGSKE